MKALSLSEGTFFWEELQEERCGLKGTIGEAGACGADRIRRAHGRRGEHGKKTREREREGRREGKKEKIGQDVVSLR